MTARRARWLAALAALVASWAAGCTTTGAAPASGRGSELPAILEEPTVSGLPQCPRAASLEPDSIADELACLLQHYIRLDTTNPPGNEVVAARFLEQLLAREEIAARVIESAPGRASVIARLRGRRRGKALMLMHHIDVVPAAAHEWRVPPLSGARRDGHIWGRGSLDNKGPGMAQLMAVVLLKRLAVPLDRDVVLLAAADEESGGAHGVRWLLEHHRDWFEDVEFVLNEGGGVIELGAGRVLYSVELAQKAPLWLRVTASGKSGHASAPGPDSAASVLVRALARLADHRFPTIVLPEVQSVFTARAEIMPEAERAPYLDLKASLEDSGFRARFMQNAADRALVQNPLAITMLAGSDKENVISDRASAVLDLRLLPRQDPQEVTREVLRVMQEPTLTVETLLSWRAHTSPRDTALFDAIEELASQRDPGAPVAANVIGGFTDCNAFRAHGVTCYGFLPIQITHADIARIHGKNERIAIGALTRATLDLHTLIEHLARAEARAASRIEPQAPPMNN